jgi:hypothetical protein
MIIEFGSITSDDIYEIFKNNNFSDKIGSYNINGIVKKIKKDL